MQWLCLNRTPPGRHDEPRELCGLGLRSIQVSRIEWSFFSLLSSNMSDSKGRVWTAGAAAVSPPKEPIAGSRMGRSSNNTARMQPVTDFLVEEGEIARNFLLE